MWLGRVELGPMVLHPMVAIFALQGALMVSKTLHIPKP
jgi:CDP-diacylglycerol--serine O-phosphatidyltransferase